MTPVFTCLKEDRAVEIKAMVKHFEKYILSLPQDEKINTTHIQFIYGSSPQLVSL